MTNYLTFNADRYEYKDTIEKNNPHTKDKETKYENEQMKS